MRNPLTSQSLRYHAPVLVCLLAIVFLIFLPTGFEGALLYQEAERCTARVLEVDNSTIVDTGLVRSGEQRCELEILDGAFEGQIVTGINLLNGSLEQDKLFSPGDRAQVVVSHDGAAITNVTMTYADKYSQDSYGFSKLSAPIPLFADLPRLDTLEPDSLEYGLVQTQLIKNKNRINDSLFTIIRLAELYSALL